MLSNRRSFLAKLPLGMGVAAAAAQPSGPSRSLRDRLRKVIDGMSIVDTHEHIISEPERYSTPIDFFMLVGQYVMNDVVSAGLSRPVRTRIENPNTPLAERWQLFEPFWKHARYTGYSQALRIAIRDIYGFPEITGATLPRINEAMHNKNKPGFYADILKKRCRTLYSIVDDYWNATPAKLDPEYFVLARKFDRFITPSTPGQMKALERQTGVSITSLSGLKQAMEKSFELSLTLNMVAVKTIMAYERELFFREVSEADAARDFDDLMQGRRKLPEGFRKFRDRPYRNMEDHMFHHLVQLADAHHVPMQIHTGLQTGNGNYMANADPTLLTNLFFVYPNVRFDLFHIGYPYHDKLSVLGKTFQNVAVDFCWAHIISPSASRQAMHMYLETVPVNKIFGYGGDYRYPELSYGHLQIAKSNIAQVLAEKVEAGFLSEDEAVEIANLMLRENALTFFGRRAVAGLKAASPTGRAD
jgi:uncharacterized protein